MILTRNFWAVVPLKSRFVRFAFILGTGIVGFAYSATDYGFLIENRLFVALLDPYSATESFFELLGGAYQRARWGIKLNCKLYCGGARINVPGGG